MSRKPYASAPLASEKMPAGIPYIIGNEFAERFSFYGMKAILVVFMTTYLMGSEGLDPMSKEDAQGWYHIFVFAVYFTPVLGSLISDIFLGKYLTILSLSLVYCAGHIVLALDETRLGLGIGLALIAIGAGGIKPCVSAHVGDQFGKQNHHLLQKVYGWFYLSINLGSFLAMLITPVLLKDVGPWAAFGLPGVLMILATLLFWMGRHRFIHIPPAGTRFLRDAFSGEGLTAFFKVALVLLFTTPFWALFDQTGSSWITQAQFGLDLSFAGIQVLPSQIQAANPFFIVVLIPVMSLWVYPAISKVFPLTAVRKISIGFFVAVISFAIPAMLETWIQESYRVVSPPASGTLTGALPNLVYQPREGFIGEDRFTFVAISSRGESEPTTVTIRVDPPGDQLRAGAQEVPTLVDTPATVLLETHANLEVDGKPAAREYEFEGLTPVFEEDDEGQPTDEIRHYRSANGMLRGTPPVLTFTPDAGFIGRDRFSFRVSAAGIESEWAPVTVVVSPRGGTPVAGSRSVATVQGQPVPIRLQGSGMKPSFLWQVLACLFLTIAEIMISVTALEFAYTQAPNTMKSLIMFLYLLPMSLGNLFTAMVNFFIQNPDGSVKLQGPEYFWFFDILILITAFLFLLVAYFYKEKTYIQETGD